MKKASIGMLIILIGVAVCVMGTQWSVTQTVQWHWELLRDTLGTTVTPIDLTNAVGDWANKPALAKEIKANDASAMSQNAVVIAFCGTDADGDTFEWTLYAWRDWNGPAELVATGTGILGSQDVVLYPDDGATATSAFWADTLVVTTDYWISAVTATTIGGNGIGKLVLDLHGSGWLLCEIAQADGTAECTTVTAYYSYF